MSSVSGFIVVVKPKRTFREFQDLPTLVQQALAEGTLVQMTGERFGERDVAQYIIDRYDMNQTLPIGKLVDIMAHFIEDSICCRMVRCYVDCHCNMIAAKLTWHEDY